MSKRKAFAPGDAIEIVAVSTSSIAARDWEPAEYVRPVPDMAGWHWVKRSRHNAFNEQQLVPARRIRRAA